MTTRAIPRPAQTRVLVLAGCLLVVTSCGSSSRLLGGVSPEPPVLPPAVWVSVSGTVHWTRDDLGPGFGIVDGMVGDVASGGGALYVEDISEAGPEVISVFSVEGHKLVDELHGLLPAVSPTRVRADGSVSSPALLAYVVRGDGTVSVRIRGSNDEFDIEVPEKDPLGLVWNVTGDVVALLGAEGLWTINTDSRRVLAFELSEGLGVDVTNWGDGFAVVLRTEEGLALYRTPGAPVGAPVGLLIAELPEATRQVVGGIYEEALLVLTTEGSLFAHSDAGKFVLLDDKVQALGGASR